MLRAFAEKHGITYLLLSDEGSRVIRALGLVNEHIAVQHAAYGGTARAHHFGTPYPGIFVLAADGHVTEKWFEQSYRVRPTVAALLEGPFAVSAADPGAVGRAASPALTVTATVGTATYRPYQKLRVNLDFTIAPGLHVYGEPVADGYTPLAVAVAPLDGLEVGALALPAPRILRIAELDEEFPVYEGAARGALPVVLTKNLGRIDLTLDVRYQACSDTLCYPPDAITVTIPLEGLENIRE